MEHGKEVNPGAACTKCDRPIIVKKTATNSSGTDARCGSFHLSSCALEVYVCLIRCAPLNREALLLSTSRCCRRRIRDRHQLKSPDQGRKIDHTIGRRLQNVPQILRDGGDFDAN